MAYTTKYTVPFYSILGKSCEFRIQEDNYSGSSTELVGTAFPAVRNGKGDDDEIEDRIIRSEFRVRINSLTNYAYLEFFTSDAYQFRGQLYVDSSLYWQGYLTPDYYSEPYIPAPYEVELLFTDGLGFLKNIDFDMANYIKENSGITEMRVTLWSGILYIIGLAKLELPYTEAINIIEENQTDTDVQSAIRQTYFDTKRFEGMSCYDALDEILKASGNARIAQQDGRWWIVSLNILKSSSFTARRYTSVGNYSDYYSVEGGITITDNSGSPLNVFLDEPNLTILPAWKKFILEQDYGFNENILDIYTFTKSGTMVTDTDGIYDERAYLLHISPAGSGGFTWDKYINFSLCNLVATTDSEYRITVNFSPALIYSIWAEVGVRFSVMLTSGATNYYMTVDGEWTTTQTNIFATASVSRNITSERIPINGNLKLRIYSLEPEVDMYFFDKDDLSVSLMRAGDTPESKTVTTNINDEQNYVYDRYEMMLGDMPDIDNNTIMYLGGLYRLSGSTYIPTNYWKVRGGTELKHLVNLIADEVSINHVRPMAMITGSLRCNFKPNSTITAPVDDNRLFVVKRFSENMYGDEWDCDLVEFAYAEVGYLKLRTDGYVLLRSGDKIKLRQ